MSLKILGNLTQLSESLQRIERLSQALSEPLERLTADIASLPDYLKSAVANEVFAEIAKHFAPMAKEPAKQSPPHGGRVTSFYSGSDSTGSLVVAYLASNPDSGPVQIYHAIKGGMRKDLKHKRSSVHSTLRYLKTTGKVVHDASTSKYRLADPK